MEDGTMGAKGLLIDITRCIGCGACHDACSADHGNPETPMETWNHESWTAVIDLGDDLYGRKICMHCQEPACASVCPVAALYKQEDGPVAYRPERCMGCRYCMVACPYGVPKYEWNKAVPLVRKCILCEERLAEGRPTACSEACPADSTVFGERAEMLEEARRRIAEAPESYHPHIFGETEAGGASVFFLVPTEFDFARLGLPTHLGPESLPELTYRVLSKIPTFAQVTATALFGIYWIINRRMTLAHDHVIPPDAAAGGTRTSGGNEGRGRS